MFFVRKETMATLLGAQKEFNACHNRGIDFHSDESAKGPEFKVWHYLMKPSQTEPSARDAVMSEYRATRRATADEDFGDTDQDAASMDDGTLRIVWSQEVTPGNTVGEPVLSVFDITHGEWIEHARAKWSEAMAQRAALQQ